MNTPYTHQVIPGITEKEWSGIEKKINTIKTFSNKIHIDFIDDEFSKSPTFLDSAPFSKFAGEFYLEAHIQVNEPINYLDSLAKAGFKKFIANIERMSDQVGFVAKAELLGEVGLGFNLNTSIEQLKVPFEDLDLVHLMTIPANESGLKFDDSSLQKIKDLRLKTTIPIEVDGGINDQTLPLCKDAGANIFVSTSYITDSQNPQEQFNKLNSLL